MRHRVWKSYILKLRNGAEKLKTWMKTGMSGLHRPEAGSTLLRRQVSLSLPVDLMQSQPKPSRFFMQKFIRLFYNSYGNAKDPH